MIATTAEGVYVLDKPAGMPAHRTDRDEPDLLSFAVKELGLPEGLAAAHRLDRDTSGIVLCAVDRALLATLSQSFAANAIKKTYFALVYGYTHDKGIVRRPLLERGRELAAVTRYRTVERFSRCSLLEVRPETGRTHQIRKHLAGIGHAVVGDRRYAPQRHPRLPAFPGRLWLHAAKLELTDGSVFEAPLPPSLETQLEVLRSRPSGPPTGTLKALG